jgi:hypothetical protein
MPAAELGFGVNPMKLWRGVCLLLVCTPAAAHHGNAEFDLSQMVRYEGTIVEVL